jgi:plasmid maintenance system antidote protein VapI
MESNKEALIKAIDRITKKQTKKEENSPTVEEMAGKLGISEKQLDAFINGEEEPPADLASRLMSLYNLKTFMVYFSSVSRVRDPRPPQNESEIRKNNSRSLKAFIGIIKDRGNRKGITITEEEMAEKIGVSPAKIPVWLEDKERTPDDLPERLLSAYKDLLDAVQAEDNRNALEHAVLWIRNRGLTQGMNITIDEMAGKVDLPGEQLYAFLNGEADTPADLGYELEKAYRRLLKGVNEVEMIEDINMIRTRPNPEARP